MAKNQFKEQHSTEKPFENLGTHKEDVIAELNDVRMNQVFPDCGFNDKAVVAKDNNGLYLTGKSYVNSGLLDPYKVYRRIEVTEKDGEYIFKK